MIVLFKRISFYMDFFDCYLINLSIKKFKIFFVLNVKYYSYIDIVDSGYICICICWRVYLLVFVFFVVLSYIVYFINRSLFRYIINIVYYLIMFLKD